MSQNTYTSYYIVLTWLHLNYWPSHLNEDFIDFSRACIEIPDYDSSLVLLFFSKILRHESLYSERLLLSIQDRKQDDVCNVGHAYRKLWVVSNPGFSSAVRGTASVANAAPTYALYTDGNKIWHCGSGKDIQTLFISVYFSEALVVYFPGGKSCLVNSISIYMYKLDSAP